MANPSNRPFFALFRLAAFGLFALTLAGLGAACGGGDVSCADWCSKVAAEDSQSCEGLLGNMSCDDFCSQAETVNTEYGCGDLFQDFINCADDADNVCQPADCIDEIRDYSDCIICGADPSNDRC